jgi:hypothetical protein
VSTERKQESNKNAFNQKALVLSGRIAGSSSAKEFLTEILEAEEPSKIVKELSPQDYFRLIKTIGEEDVLVLLESGTPDQWQYLLDLELWNKDRLDVSRTSHWLSLLQQAEGRQLIHWLFNEGESLIRYYFFQSLEVAVKRDENEFDRPPEGFFSLDGFYYLRINDPEYRTTLAEILRIMAVEDYEKYQDLLFKLGEVNPDELEEEMYRLRNVRLAEQGFLPYEEALSVYAPVDPAVLKTKESSKPPTILIDEDIRGLIPVLPLAQTEIQNQFLEVVKGIRDPLLLERLRLEFSNLANQILSADRCLTFEIEVLIQACNQAARIINLALEKTCGHNLLSVEDLLRRQNLITLFRVGFGLVLKCHWEAEKWLKGSWFHRQGLGPFFWGEHWGGVLSGLLKTRPMYYIRSSGKETFRDFEGLSDLRESLEALQALMVLDGFLEKMTASFPLPEELWLWPETTCHTLLFNFWARLCLKMEPAFSGISLTEAKRFLSRLQGHPSEPPYGMDVFQAIFVRDLLEQAAEVDPQVASILSDTLARIWKDFQQEFERVLADELDPKSTKYLTINPPP